MEKRRFTLAGLICPFALWLGFIKGQEARLFQIQRVKMVAFLILSIEQPMETGCGHTQVECEKRTHLIDSETKRAEGEPILRGMCAFSPLRKHSLLSHPVGYGADHMPILFDKALIGRQCARNFFNELPVEHVQNSCRFRCIRFSGAPAS